MASEDIGNRRPAGIDPCLNAVIVLRAVGSPEGSSGVLQAIVYLAWLHRKSKRGNYITPSMRMKDSASQTSTTTPWHFAQTRRPS